MATNPTHDMTEQQRTFSGFIKLLEFGAIASATVVLLLYFVFAR